MTVDGKWSITINSPMGAQQAELIFKVDGSRLTGTQSARQSTMDIVDGRVDGSNVAWSAEINEPFAMKLEFNGMVNADRIAGSVKAGTFGSFPFAGDRIG